ncbi:MAG: 3-deoxy-D-manno-octulosonic acid transferase, partial [Nitrospinota bacterium]|nr:3-deoxy-D-manno-octulosonic acid transferase [Nitrospinota bacterium]
MSRIIYNTALYLGLPALASAYAWKMTRKPAYRSGFFQKLGYTLPRQSKKTIWIHAVSVGETMAAARLARRLCREQTEYRVMFSTTTPTGQQVALEQLAPEANVFYFPFDLPGAAARAVEAVNPAVLALVDTEFWPNVIHACASRGAAVALVNGRISDRSHPRYLKAKRFIKPVLEEVALFMAQSPRDAERFLEIGAPPERVVAGGNLKFDQDTAPVSQEEKDAIRRSLGVAPDELVVLLGSVHRGEEAAIEAAADILRPGRRMVIAPRRIDDMQWIEKTLAPYGMTISRRSTNPAMPPGDHTQIPVIDTFGELNKIYAMADAVFVGGSLINHGGQNPLEPAGRGVPTIFGPDMSNFQEASQTLVEAQGAWIAATKDEIAQRLEALLTDRLLREKAGAAARSVVEINMGATDRALERIMSLAR